MTQFLYHRRFRVFLLCVLVLVARAASAEAQSAVELCADYERLSVQFAASVPGWRPPRPASGTLLFVAPDQYTVAEDRGSQFRNQRNDYTDELFRLARHVAEAGQLSLAFQWATETLRENPDHAEARRVLGYEQRDGQWLTRYGLRMADAGKTWHPRFGWLETADVDRYEAGERRVGKRWMTVDEDAARRTDLRSGWQVRTDHFLVTTNHSLADAADLAARLERLYQVWRQLFAGFHLTEREVQRLFAGEREPRRQIRPFRVYYHCNRDEYSAALVRRQPRIAETLGIYFDREREAHFFADTVVAGGSPANEATDGPPVATLYHEAVHQLFYEAQPAAKYLGELANFWVIEGVATYFETLIEHDDPQMGLYYTIGQATAGRLPAARERLLEGFYVPLSDLTRLSKRDIQGHADEAKLYSQSAGLAAFLMDAEGGRYRESLVRYLTAVYAGRDDPQTLSEAAGTGYAQLDAAYRRYMESLP